MMHQLTSGREYTLRVELTDWDGESRFAEYTEFSVANEMDGFALHIGQYDGNAGDSLSMHNGARFSTYEIDRDTWSDGNCAVEHGGDGGWWYYSECFQSTLNGEYRSSSDHTTASYGGISWYHWKHTHYYSMKEVIMKICHTFA